MGFTFWGILDPFWHKGIVPIHGSDAEDALWVPVTQLYTLDMAFDHLDVINAVCAQLE
jgi:hypothetical protein